MALRLLVALSALQALASATALAEDIDQKLVVRSHEPSYFVVGKHDSTTARFQFSFKYKLFDDDSVPTRWLPPVNGLHFAYTQTAIWDIGSESAPFRDTSYRPAGLYEWTGEDRVAGLPTWSLQTGLEHESNGRDGDRSRSMNVLFFHPKRRIPLAEDRYLAIGAKWVAYLEREDNADITDFRGHGTYELSFGRQNGLLLRSATRIGKSGRGSVQIDASYPLRRQYFANTGGYLYVQYFNGYGETLLDYNQRGPQQLRIGFAIVR